MTATNKRRFTKDGTSFPELNKRSEISIIHSERSPNFTHQKIYDTPVEREHIEEKLASGTFVIVLQTVPSRNSHCRAWNCLPRELSGRPNICSDFRFNLRDLSGRRYESNHYYHITCMEQILDDLAPLVCKGQLKMEGGITHLSHLCYEEQRFHQAIEDWFHFAGRTFDVQFYEKYNKVLKEWIQTSSVIEIGHQLKNHVGDSEDCDQCKNISVEPRKNDYFPDEPRVCLLSDVLASVVGVAHVDGLIRKD